MSRNKLIEKVEEKFLIKKRPEFNIGDTIRVHSKIKEGSKERVQVFAGTVIARKGGGISETFSLYRNAYGSSMEKVFILNSPRIEKIEVMKFGKVRRAKLYYIRGKTGKKAKIQEKIFSKKEKNAKKAVKPVEDQSSIDKSPIDQPPVVDTKKEES